MVSAYACMFLRSKQTLDDCHCHISHTILVQSLSLLVPALPSRAIHVAALVVKLGMDFVFSSKALLLLLDRFFKERLDGLDGDGCARGFSV